MQYNSVQETLWNILETFFLAFKDFKNISCKFETTVDNLCSEKQTPKKELIYALQTDDWMALVNINDLKKLLYVRLRTLRKLLEQLRPNCYNISSFEVHIADVYYNLGALYSESYYFTSYILANLECKNGDNFLPKKVTETLFQKMGQIKEIFGYARDELEKLIKEYESNTIILRSLYLFGEEILNEISSNYFLEFIQKIYGQDHLLELYIRVAYSFLNSGFSEEAKKSANKAIQLLAENEHSFSCENQQRLKDFFHSYHDVVQGKESLFVS